MSRPYQRAAVRPPLRIAIDYTTGAYPGAGVARYTRSLVEALTRIDRYNHYTLFYGARDMDRTTEAYAHLVALVEGRPNVQVHELAWTPRQLTILWQRLRLPWPVEDLQVDVQGRARAAFTRALSERSGRRPDQR